MIIRVLGPDDAPAYVALRKASLVEAPLAFASSPADDRASSVPFMEASLGEADGPMVVGAFDGERLVGASGLFREQKLKLNHMANVYGMYVSPGARGQGVGQALMEKIIAMARGMDGLLIVRLSVSDTQLAAKRLYERLGFVQWGFEPKALSYKARLVGEHHLSLDLYPAI